MLSLLALLTASAISLNCAHAAFGSQPALRSGRPCASLAADGDSLGMPLQIGTAMPSLGADGDSLGMPMQIGTAMPSHTAMSMPLPMMPPAPILLLPLLPLLLEAPVQLPNVEAGPPGAVPDLREILAFALPTLAMMLSSPLLSLIDTTVVGLVASTSQLAALGPSTKACDHLAYLCSALGVATTSLAAKALAKGNEGDATRVVATALSTALWLGVAVAVALLSAAPPLMALLMGSAGDAVALSGAVEYTRVRAFGYPAALVGMVLQAGFIARKDATSPLLAVPLAAIANLALDALLVGPLRLGAAGAACGTVAAQTVSCALLLRMWVGSATPPVRRPPLGHGPPREGPAAEAQPSRSPSRGGSVGARRVLGRGAALRRGASAFARPRRADLAAQACFVGPMMLGIGMRSSMALVFTATAASLGTVALAAHQVYESLYWLFCPLGDALGILAQAYLPALLSGPEGHEDLARSLQARVAGAAAAVGVAAGGVCAWLAAVAPHVFTRHAEVCAAMVPPAPTLGACMVFYIVAGALEGALLARRRLRVLAASHALNLCLALAALQALVGRPGFALSTVWQVVACVNIVRCLQFGGTLALPRRREPAAAAAAAAAAPLAAAAPSVAAAPSGASAGD